MDRPVRVFKSKTAPLSRGSLRRSPAVNLPGGHHRRRLSFEAMEPRHLLTTFVVDSLEDNTNADGMVTLREAIQAAEMDLAVGDAVAGSGADTITFAPGLQGTINLSTVGDSSSGDSAFSISTQITIDGSNGGTGITLDAGGNKRHFLVTGAGNLTLDTLTLERGSAESGGAINNAGTLSISSSTLFNNTAGVTFSGIGGAINNDGGSIVVDNSTFSGNTAVTQPGNVGAGAGGAIYNSNGDFRATSTTFTGNTASRGGALFTSVFGQVRTVSLENSILANSSGDDLENFGGTVDARYSLIESGLGPGASGVNGVNVGNIFGLDPGLEFLGNTGGPTQTHRLAPNSPAVNAGDPAAASGVGGIPNFDQRGNGFGRVVEGRIDMGATELQGPKLVSFTRQNPTAQFTAADTLTFRAEFDSEVVNVDATDFTVAGGSTTIVSGVLMLSESMYDITVSGGDLAGFNGTVGLDVASGTDIDDLNGFSLLPVEPPTDETYGLANQSTVTVSTLADGIDGDFSAGQLSLREAVAFANTLPTVTTINFDGGLNGGTITLGSQLVLTDSVTIAGPGADQLTISGGEATRLFFLASGRTATIDDLTLADGNAVGEQGGVITFVGSTVNFNRVLMTGNTSLNGGNTIEAAFGILNITDSALVNNRGVLAAIRSQDNQLTITNTTISNNASAGIRAISAFAAPDSLTLENVTIADNSGTGVALVTVGGALPMMIYSNTIVANNGGDGSFSVAGGQSPSVPITSQGYNLLSDTPSGDAAHAAALGDLRNTDPLLGPLQDNGGPTPTHALLPGSPAIDAGNSTLTTDQRGLTRSADLDSVANAAGGNGSDIGAFEVQAEPSSLTVTTTADVVDNTDMLTSLREAIMFANSTPGADTIGFDAGVFTGGAASVIRLSGTELSITESLVIDGLTGTDVLVTADSAGDDTLVAGTFITDAIANTNTADNSRVLNFTGSAGDLTLRGLTVTGGGVAGGGGGIRFGGSVFSGTLLIDQSTVSGNRTTGDGAYGGGIYTSSGAVTLTSSTVSGNRTTGNFSDGGGVFTRTGAVSLTSSSVSGNRTAGDVAYGGGIYTSSGAVTLTGSTVSGNQSSGLGGGFQTLTGAVTLTSSTVSGNQSGGSGGGIYTFDSPVLIQSSTITGNQALGVGGGIGLLADNFDDDERLTILNSIVAGNSDNGTAPDFLAPGDPANDLTVGFSLIGDNTGTTLAEAQTADAAGNLIGSPTSGGLIDPLLGPLADNGGPTLTHALLPGSPAIDAGGDSVVPGLLFNTGVDSQGNLLGDSLDDANYALLSQPGGGSLTDATVPADGFPIPPWLPNESDSRWIGPATVDAQGPAGEYVYRTTFDLTGFDVSSLDFRIAGRWASDNSGTDILINGVSTGQANQQFAAFSPFTIDAGFVSGVNTLDFVVQNSGIGTSPAGLIVDDIQLIASGTTDQRGLTRPVDLDSVANAAGGNGSDIGAFEVQAEPSSLTVTTTADVVDNTDNLTSLREAIMFANSTPGADTIGFDAGVFTGGAASVIRLSGTELSITESLVINGLTGTDVLVTADSAGDDTLVAGTFVTDAITNTSTADNSRVLNFTGSTGDLTLRGLTITGGSVAGSGGGIRFGGSVFSGSLLIDQSTVSGNRTVGDGARGGGIYTRTGAVSLTSSTVSGNSTTGNFSDGGGICTFSGAATLTSSTVSGNRTPGNSSNGGGIFTFNGAVTLTSSTVSGNQSTGRGGGIITIAGAVTLTSSTVSGNQSDGDGGGIYTDDSTVLIQSSTITGNQALGVGGGIGLLADNYNDDERLTILNSIVAGNSDNGTAPDFLAPGDPANDLTVGFSLIGDNTGTTLSEAQTADAAGNLIGSPTGGGLIDPLLGPLADNGGPTLTHTLLPGSPALDAGNSNLLTDQRGFTRPVDLASTPNANGGNGSDIGAFEQQPANPTPGDYNGDLIVNAADYTVWRDTLGATGVTPFSGADGDGDGAVTATDYTVWVNNFGATFTPPPVATITVASAAPLIETPAVATEPVAGEAETTPAASDAALAFFLAEPAAAPLAKTVASTESPTAAGGDEDLLLLTLPLAAEADGPGVSALDEAFSVDEDDSEAEEPLALALGGL